MKICLAAGIKTKQVAQQIDKYVKTDIKTAVAYEKVSQLVDEIIKAGTSFLTEVDVIIIFDSALKGAEDVEVRREDLLRLQDILNSKRFNKKLYYLTKDPNIYKLMSKDSERHINFIYPNTMILRYEGKVKITTITDTIVGKNDNSVHAISHPNFGLDLVKTREEQLVEELKQSGDTVDESIKNFGKNEPISEFDAMSSIDNPRYLADRNRQERAAKKEERLANKNKNKKRSKGKNQDINDIDDSPKDVIYERARNIPVDDVTLSKYKTKIIKDYGLIGVSGITGVGVSGVVSNMAVAYSILNKSVAVLDLNLDDRKQTVYFDEFSEGEPNTLSGLIKKSKSKTLLKNNPYELIDVFSISREIDEEINDEDILDNFSNAVDILKEQYDIVIADIPIHLLYGFEYEDALKFNSFLWVTENITISVEDLIVLKLRDLVSRNDDTIKEILNNSFIIFNKYVEDRKGYTDNVFDLIELKELLGELPSPYSKITTAGHIPYTSDWEKQLYGEGIWVDYSADNERAIISILGKLMLK